MEKQEQQMFSSNLPDELRSDAEMNEPLDLEHAASLTRVFKLKLARMPPPYHGAHGRRLPGSTATGSDDL